MFVKEWKKFVYFSLKKIILRQKILRFDEKKEFFQEINYIRSKFDSVVVWNFAANLIVAGVVHKWRHTLRVTSVLQP